MAPTIKQQSALDLIPDAVLAAVADALPPAARPRLRLASRRCCAAVDARLESVAVACGSGAPGLGLDALPSLAARWPRVWLVAFALPESEDAFYPAATAALAAALAALPDGAWPAVTDVRNYSHPRVLLAAAAAEVVRICPQLVRLPAALAIGGGDGGSGDDCGMAPEPFFRRLGAATRLKRLRLDWDLSCMAAADAAAAAAALGALRSLASLSLCCGGDGGAPAAAALLPAVLPRLGAITDLQLDLDALPTECLDALAPAARLPGLRQLRLTVGGDKQKAAMELLRRVGPLDALTRLELDGNDGGWLCSLATVTAACPALRELLLKEGQVMGVDGAVLQHLTVLDLISVDSGNGGLHPIAAPNPELSAAAPRLARMRVAGRSWGAAVALAAGHPALRELVVEAPSMEGVGGAVERWLWAAARAPALEDLIVTRVLPYSYGPIKPHGIDDPEPLGAELAYEERAAAALHRACFYVSRCTALTSLNINVAGPPLGAALACIGAAAGPRLRALWLRGGVLPDAPADAARVLCALPLFPRLERLDLDLCDTLEAEGTEAGGAAGGSEAAAAGGEGAAVEAGGEAAAEAGGAVGGAAAVAAGGEAAADAGGEAAGGEGGEAAAETGGGAAADAGGDAVPSLEARVRALLAPLPAVRALCPALTVICIGLPAWAPVYGEDAAEHVGLRHPRWSAVVVRASAESRRAVLSSFAGAAAMLAATSVEAATSIDLFDDRAAKKKGYDLIYEARDLDLPQNVREGFTQARANLDETKGRVTESVKRIKSNVLPSVEKAYWTEAREELRRQVGTLRFDLNTLAGAKGKDGKKAALAARKDFLAAVEDLDFALRSKNKDSARSKLLVAQSKLESAVSAVL
ncbi:MAG: oxygen evolving enhancer protein 3-domain-containing protein [Monoraphidium minutum]|nr:MAG: oxygen evolving enhancer protein 3-domain-containing protein [Monoraphidium minutum]